MRQYRRLKEAIVNKISTKRRAGPYILPFVFDNHLAEKERAGPEVIKLLSCSTQLSLKFITLINVKMPTLLAF